LYVSRETKPQNLRFCCFLINWIYQTGINTSGAKNINIEMVKNQPRLQREGQVQKKNTKKIKILIIFLLCLKNG